MKTRDMISKSWEAAKRIAETSGAVTANAASSAGQYLELAGDDPRRAISMLPKDAGAFWARVASHLALVVEEERGSRGPLLRASGER